MRLIGEFVSISKPQLPATVLQISRDAGIERSVINDSHVIIMVLEASGMRKRKIVLGN